MTNPNNTYQLFDRFLTGEMSPSEQEEFQEELRNDSSLQEEFETYRTLTNSIQQVEKDQFRKELLKMGEEQINRELTQKTEDQDAKVKSINSNKLRYWVAAAASVIILLIPGSLYIYNHIYHPQQVFEKYYTPYNNIVAPTMRNDTKESALQQTLGSYLTGDYEQSIADLRSYINNHQEKNIEARFFLGISYLETNQFKNAVEQFQTVIGKRDHLANQAKWYLGLTYLKMGKQKKAENQMQEIANHPSNSYHQKARELLNDL